jgi:hypothetical protein
MQLKPRAVSPFPCVILSKRCHHQLIQNFRLVSFKLMPISSFLAEKKMINVQLADIRLTA